MKAFFPVLFSSFISFSALAQEPHVLQSDDSTWITIGSDALDSMTSDVKKNFSIRVQKQSVNKSSDAISIVNIPEKNLLSLSQYMHDNHRRCGGYVWHKSLEDAQAFLSGFKKSTEKRADFTIDNAQVVNALLSQMSTSNMSATVQNMGSYNNRYYSQNSGAEAAGWLKTHWENIVGERSDINVSFFEHVGWAQPSVIATVTGTSKPEEVVVIGGHLDSINQSSPSTGRAPGYDDNASGIAVVTEALRVLVASGFKPERTVKFMGYAAEEVGLRGSNEIAIQHNNDNINVVGVAQFDMTGFKGSSNREIVFMSDYTSSAQNEFMADLLETYFPNIRYAFDPCGYACSDHASWTRQGFPASFPFESYSSQYNRDIHTTGDDHFDEEHASHFLKLALAYMAELAKGELNDSGPSASVIQFTAGNIEMNESSSITVTVQRSGDFGDSASITYQTIDGTAIAGTDYQSASGTLSWDIGDGASKSFVVNTLSVDENKSFSLRLSDAGGNASLGSNNTIQVTIQNEQTSGGGNRNGGSLPVLLLSFLGLVVALRNRKL